MDQMVAYLFNMPNQANNCNHQTHLPLTDLTIDDIQGLICSRSQLKDQNSEFRGELPNVPRFVILGKPSTGKSNLAKRLCSIWGCEYINASCLICENIENETSLGVNLQNLMNNGRDLDDALVLKILLEKLNSSECISKGYILDDIPNHSETAISIEEQLNLLLTMKNSVNCVIYLQISDDMHRLLWENRRIDPLTGNIYTLTYTTTNKKERTLPRLYSQSCLSTSVPFIDREMNNRLVIRHEDLSESLDAHFKFHNEVFLPALQVFFSKLGTIPLIRLEGSFDDKVLFENAIKALYDYSNTTQLRLLNLFGDTIEDDLNTNENLSDITARKSKCIGLKRSLFCHRSP